jgi:hypothetical protein
MRCTNKCWGIVRKVFHSQRRDIEGYQSAMVLRSTRDVNRFLWSFKIIHRLRNSGQILLFQMLKFIGLNTLITRHKLVVVLNIQVIVLY